jgi:hypothetical protein
MVSGMTTRWPYLILRGTTAVLALLGVGQAVLAGGFLAGHYDMLTMHLYSGVAMVAIALLQTITVLFLRRIGGPADVVRVGLILPVALAAQAALGMTHILLLHVPIGAFMVVGLVRMMRSVWRDLPEQVWDSGSAPAAGASAPSEKAARARARSEKGAGTRARSEKGAGAPAPSEKAATVAATTSREVAA